MDRRSFLALPLLAAVPQTTFNQLPPNLPRPTDDGGARHLKGMALPDIGLPSTANRTVNLSKVAAPRTVIYCYPMTAGPTASCRRDGTTSRGRAAARRKRAASATITATSRGCTPKCSG